MDDLREFDRKELLVIIDITNNCDMQCPHCMQRSEPGNHMMMDKATFILSVSFANNLKASAILLSGGEPTLHPQLCEFVEILQQMSDKSLSRAIFLLSNGSFLLDNIKREQIKRLIKDKKLNGIQITSVPRLYKNWKKIHEAFKEYEQEFDKKMTMFSEDISHIKDLGRAHDNKDMFIDDFGNSLYPSCFSGFSIIKQSETIEDFDDMSLYMQKFCSPVIDYKGNIHVSESVCCPSFGNVLECVYDGGKKVFDRIKEGKPCGKCYNYKRFMLRNDRRALLIKKMLEI